MNEKKSPIKCKFARVAVIVACVCALFMLCMVPVSALVNSIPPDDNVYNGETCYPFVPIKSLKYVSTTSSGGFYWKDIPTSNVMTLRGMGSSWVDVGQPLSGSYYQNIYSNEVKVGVTEPTSIYGMLSDVSVLPSYYDDYKRNGRCDIQIYEIMVNNTGNINPNGDHLSYQCPVVTFEDYYFTGDVLSSSIQWQGSNYSYLKTLTPTINFYLGMTAPLKQGRVHMSATIEYYDTDTHENHSIFVESQLNFIFPDDVTGSYHTYQITPMSWLYSEALAMDNGRFADTLSNAEFVAIRNCNVRMGNVENIINDCYAGIYTGGFSGVHVMVPALRPYDASYTEYSYAKDNKSNDINYALKDMLIEYEKIDVERPVEVTSLSDFVGGIVTSTLNIKIVEGLTLGGILFSFVTVALTLSVLKYFAGG